MTRVMALIRCFVVVAATRTIAAATQPSGDTFDAAYTAIKDPLDPRDPATLERAVKDYQDLANRFPNDPHLWRATLDLAIALSFDHRPESYPKAYAAFSQLQPLADPSSADGRLICDRIMSFDVFNGDKWHPERLARTKELADKYEAWAARQDSRAPLLHVWAIKGEILAEVGPNRGAVAFLLNKLRTSESWGAAGYYASVWASDRSKYQAVLSARQELLNSLANAICGSDDSDVDAQVAKAGLVGDYPTLRGALERWRSFRNQDASVKAPPEAQAGDPKQDAPTPTTAPGTN